MARSQQGMALLVVLLLLAVMVILATGMTSRYRLLWQRTQNQQVYAQQHWYLKGAESFVARVLDQDISDSPDKTSRAQFWASESKVFPVEDSTLTGYIRDEQACFNLNSLSLHDESAPSVMAIYNGNVFKQLLLSLNVDELQAEQITAGIEDWLDTNTVSHVYGGEDNVYQAIQPPYLPANHLMQDVSELRMVRGIGSEIYQRLLPYVCVLPSTTLQVDINTLLPTQAKLVAALFLDSVSEDTARSVLESRPREGWDTVADFLSQDVLAETANVGDSIDKALSVNSYYFSSWLTVQTEEQKTLLVSLFYRQGNNKVAVIRRHFGEVW